MPFSEAEARIRRLMARLTVAEYRTGIVQDQILRTRQDLGGFYQIGAGGCVTTLKGRATGCSQHSLDGATVKVTGHQSGADYGTFTFNASVDPDYWFAPVQLLDADTSVDLVVRGPGPRFQDNDPVEMAITNRCGENVYDDGNDSDYIVCKPAADYYYPLGNSQYNCPLYKTLNFTDEILGTGVLTRVGGLTGYWVAACYELPSRAFTIPGFISCPAANSVCSMRLNLNGSPQWCNYQGTYCPIAADCSSASPVPVITWGTPQAGATTWPGPFTLYDVTYNLPGVSERTYHENRTYVLRVWES